LPDCLSSRLRGDLDEVEGAVVAIEAQRASGASVESAAGDVREDIELPGALRWARRRLIGIRQSLSTLATVLPQLSGTGGRLADVRCVLGTEHALVRLREVASAKMGMLPPPLGYGPRHRSRGERRRRSQHEAGPDPPAPKR
jgi:hypothetical protein